MDELKFVAETEQAIATWRGARDEVARASRVDAKVAKHAQDYQREHDYGMPAVMQKEIRHDLLAQERVKAEAAEADAVQKYEAARTVLETVRGGTETLKNTYEGNNLLAAQHWLLHGTVGGILKKYQAAPADDPFLFVVEEGVTLGLPKLNGVDVSRAEAEAAVQLKQAIQQRRQARWPSWTHEAATRLKKTWTVNDDAYLRLKRMKAIG